jgi:hypothetical protein
MITNEDIVLVVKAAKFSGFKDVKSEDLELNVWNKGLKNHLPVKLPNTCGAVYIFEYNKEYLKVGKVGQKSNPRYQHQHYRVSSNISTFAKSLVNDSSNNLTEEVVSDWIKENTTRYNIIIPCKYDRKFINFVEAFFILKCQPKYEGRL